MTPFPKLEPLPPLSYSIHHLDRSHFQRIRYQLSRIHNNHFINSIMAPSRPSLIPEYTAGPTPGRVLPNTTPTIVVHDAGMVSECHKIWPIKAHHNQYARYEAFSPKGGVPTIFTTSHREWEALDWLKNFAGLSTHTDSWARGTRGKGVVKQYEHMRSVAYLYQAMMVSAVSLSRQKAKH